jgi:hypothetical protein
MSLLLRQAAAGGEVKAAPERCLVRPNAEHGSITERDRPPDWAARSAAAFRPGSRRSSSAPGRVKERGLSVESSLAQRPMTDR